MSRKQSKFISVKGSVSTYKATTQYSLL